MAVNHLLLTDVAQEEQDDDILASLVNIAYKTPQPLEEAPKKKKKKKRVAESRRSKFFFTPTDSFTDELNKGKQADEDASHTALTYLDKEVEARGKTYSKELPEALQNNISEVREFFLNDIGPLMLAAQAGTVQAGQVLQRVLNTEIDNSSFIQFERMVSKASTIKMARFIASYLDLPLRTVETLLQTIQPPAPREVLFMQNDPLAERRFPKEKAKPVEQPEE